MVAGSCLPVDVKEALSELLKSIRDKIKGDECPGTNKNTAVKVVVV
jgi:hypothetical protein